MCFSVGDCRPHRKTSKSKHSLTWGGSLLGFDAASFFWNVVSGLVATAVCNVIVFLYYRRGGSPKPQHAPRSKFSAYPIIRLFVTISIGAALTILWMVTFIPWILFCNYLIKNYGILSQEPSPLPIIVFFSTIWMISFIVSSYKTSDWKKYIEFFAINSVYILIFTGLCAVITSIIMHNSPPVLLSFLSIVAHNILLYRMVVERRLFGHSRFGDQI